MQAITRVTGQPGPHWRGLVGGIVVEHQGDVEPGRHSGFDRGQELAELDGAVTLATAADNPAGGDVESGELGRRAVALVIMAAPLDLSRPHRKQRLSAVEHLDLRFFIDAQHQRMVGRVE